MKAIQAIFNMRKTHNYLVSTNVKGLNLIFEKSTDKVKAINFATQLIIRVAKEVTIKVSLFAAQTSLFTVKIDDFKLIIGLKFLQDMRIVIYPYGNTLIILGANPCMIQATVGKSSRMNLSTIQVKKCLKYNKTTYLAHFF